ncbi:MAG: 2-oxoacid:acceptor oxidoreductase family protein [Deltaproteobacteria bacterium]|jgi:2-oxoglutarate ferredoxin oxidoreductase subunit gamma|nr:2-oxoacid:acceptor oxidoreductase family protein [Deltaproteobacteria bacterium]
MLYKCVFSGSGGQGSALLAKLVCQAAIIDKLKVVMTQTYGIEQRGGDSTAFVIVSDSPIQNPLVEADGNLGIALSASTYETCLASMGNSGRLFYNSSLIKSEIEKAGLTQIPLMASDIAIEVGGSPRGLNLVLLGAAVASTKILKIETVEAVLQETIGNKKPALLETNLASFRAGLAKA